jgi:hypothetical protein
MMVKVMTELMVTNAIDPVLGRGGVGPSEVAGRGVVVPSVFVLLVLVLLVFAVELVVFVLLVLFLLVFAVELVVFVLLVLFLLVVPLLVLLVVVVIDTRRKKIRAKIVRIRERRKTYRRG